jgi:hypothetical protein
VPWPKHKNMIKDTKDKFPNVKVVPELIMGLPGMTFDRILETHLEFLDVPMSHIYSYEWILLKKSPAYSKDYRDRQNLAVTKTFYPSIFTGLDSSTINLREFEKDPNVPINKNQAYYIDMVYDSILGIQGVIYNKIITRVYNLFASRDRLSELPNFYRDNNNKFLEASLIESENQRNYYNKYGFYLWGSIEGESIRNYEITLDRYINV